MPRDRADHRRLDAVAALTRAAGGLPRAWAGAWAVLAFASALIAAPVLVPLGGVAGLAYHGLLAATVLMAWGALTRIALGVGRGLGPGGLQLGAGEARIAAGLGLNLLFLGLVCAVLALVAVAAAGAAGLDLEAVRSGSWMREGATARTAALGLVGMVLVAAPLLMAMRLSLAAPASIGRGRLVSTNSMGVAHGAFWPLLALWLVIAAGWAALPALHARGGIDWTLARVIGALALPWLWAPISAGALADAYRQLEYWTPGEG